MNDVSTLGQVFTPPWLVDMMFNLSKCNGRSLEPSAGDGAFSRHLFSTDDVVLEIDPQHAAKSGAITMDFFHYPTTERFDTIIGNPPYVRCQDIDVTTAICLKPHFDGRTNLFIHFIDKALDHLNIGGELIFVIPRELLSLTSAAPLNNRLTTEGCFTDWIEFGDRQIFTGFSPNVAVMRWVKSGVQAPLNDGRLVTNISGRIIMRRPDMDMSGPLLSDLFEVCVGAVSGADECFENEEFGTPMVFSETRATGKTRRMIYNQPHFSIWEHKERLLARKIKNFTEGNWFMWGRDCRVSYGPRIYVNAKTRQADPFFLSSEVLFDGSVLGLFSRVEGNPLGEICDELNKLDWEGLGLQCDGRFLFGQRSLGATPLPANFRKYLP